MELAARVGNGSKADPPLMAAMGRKQTFGVGGSILPLNAVSALTRHHIGSPDSSVVPVINLQQNCHMQIIQCRMARSGLRWSLSDLAEQSGVSRRTIARFELGGRVSAESREAMRRTLEGAGAKFIEDDQTIGVVLEGHSQAE